MALLVVLFLYWLSWYAFFSCRTILLSVVSLLTEPNDSSPANVDAGVQFRAWKMNNCTQYPDTVKWERFINVCVCACVCVCVCVYLYLCACVWVCVCVCACVCGGGGRCVCVCVSVCVSVCIYLRACARVCVGVRACVRIHMWPVGHAMFVCVPKMMQNWKCSSVQSYIHVYLLWASRYYRYLLTMFHVLAFKPDS